jgi:hypothetical protein
MLNSAVWELCWKYKILILTASTLVHTFTWCVRKLNVGDIGGWGGSFSLLPYFQCMSCMPHRVYMCAADLHIWIMKCLFVIVWRNMWLCCLRVVTVTVQTPLFPQSKICKQCKGATSYIRILWNLCNCNEISEYSLEYVHVQIHAWTYIFFIRRYCCPEFSQTFTHSCKICKTENMIYITNMLLNSCFINMYI